MTVPVPRLVHPGPVQTARYSAQSCRAHPGKFHLRAGRPVDVAVREAFTEAGFSAGYLRLAGTRLSALDYVIPAPAPGDGRAAWYSPTYSLKGDVRLDEAGVHLGLRDGAAFLHCHGLWRDREGPLHMGHMLCPQSVLAEDILVPGWGLTGALLKVAPDPETRFDLFAPRATGYAGSGGQAAVLCTLRPNESPEALLAEIAAEHGMTRARIEGIGSLIGTRFEGAILDSYATEVLIRSGRLSDGQARLQVACVGFDGLPKQGWLTPGVNRICVTAEILLVAMPSD